MKKLLFAALLVFLPWHAWADSNTTRLGLTKPGIGTTNWGPKINTNYDIVDSSVAIQSGTNTFTGANTFTGTIGFVGAASTGTRTDTSTTTYRDAKEQGTITDTSTRTYQGAKIQGTRTDVATTTAQGAAINGTKTDNSTTTFTGGNTFSGNNTFSGLNTNSGTVTDTSTRTYQGAKVSGTKTDNSTTTLQGTVTNGNAIDNSTTTHTGTQNFTGTVSGVATLSSTQTWTGGQTFTGTTSTTGINNMLQFNGVVPSSGMVAVSQGPGLPPKFQFGGTILQVVFISTSGVTQKTSTSGSYATTGLSGVVTAKQVGSTIVVLVMQNFGASGTAGTVCTARISRDATDIITPGDYTVAVNDSTTEFDSGVFIQATDTGQSGAVTYSTKFARSAGSGTCIVNSTIGATGGNGANMIVVEFGK